MKHHRHDVVRRLARLEGPAPNVIHSLRVGEDHLCDWSTGEEFDRLVELTKVGVLPLEAEECQTLLRRAWARRARKEPRSIGAGLLFEEGRIEEAEEELRRRRAWGLDRARVTAERYALDPLTLTSVVPVGTAQPSA